MRSGWMVVGSVIGGAVGAVLFGAVRAEAVPSSYVTATFVGVTATARTGAEGFDAMNDDCAALFTRARICRDTELFDSRVLATEVHRDSFGTTAVTPYGLTIRSNSSNGGSNCSVTNTSTMFDGTLGNGLELTAVGNLRAVSCATSLVTACCAP
ncbi:MAG: hypothetical protein ABMB14_32140 [Myxococcota bacterium]